MQSAKGFASYSFRTGTKLPSIALFCRSTDPSNTTPCFVTAMAQSIVGILIVTLVIFAVVYVAGRVTLGE
jgi:hypothetical protein